MTFNPTQYYCWHCKNESMCACDSCVVPDDTGQWVPGLCHVCRFQIFQRFNSGGNGWVDLWDFQEKARDAAIAALRDEGSAHSGLHMQVPFVVEERETVLYRIVMKSQTGDSQRRIEPECTGAEPKNDAPIPEFIPTLEDLELLFPGGELQSFRLHDLMVRRDESAPWQMEAVALTTGKSVSDREQVEYYEGTIASCFVLTYQALICLAKALLKAVRIAWDVRHWVDVKFDQQWAMYADFRLCRVLNVLRGVSPSAHDELLKTMKSLHKNG